MKYDCFNISFLKDYKLDITKYYSNIIHDKYNINDLYNAFYFIHKFSFGINSIRGNILCSLYERRGTCATKNGLFYVLCLECDLYNFSLYIGAFKLFNKIKISVFIKIGDFMIDLSHKNYIKVNEYELVSFESIQIKQLNMAYKNYFIAKIKNIYNEYEIY